MPSMLSLCQDAGRKLSSLFIPKKSNLMIDNDYRPISLCNIVCKMVAKILVHRIKPILSTLISKEQGVFVLGCNVVENILIGRELCTL